MKRDMQDKGTEWKAEKEPKIPLPTLILACVNEHRIEMCTCHCESVAR